MINSRYRALLIFISFLYLSGCSTYPNKFKGDPAKGTWGAMPMDIITMIENGEADLIYKNVKAVKDYEKNEVIMPELNNKPTTQIIYKRGRG